MAKVPENAEELVIRWECLDGCKTTLIPRFSVKSVTLTKAFNEGSGVCVCMCVINKRTAFYS